MHTCGYDAAVDLVIVQLVAYLAALVAHVLGVAAAVWPLTLCAVLMYGTSRRRARHRVRRRTLAIRVDRVGPTVRALAPPVPPFAPLAPVAAFAPLVALPIVVADDEDRARCHASAVRDLASPAWWLREGCIHTAAVLGGGVALPTPAPPPAVVPTAPPAWSRPTADVRPACGPGCIVVIDPDTGEYLGRVHNGRGGAHACPHTINRSTTRPCPGCGGPFTYATAGREHTWTAPPGHHVHTTEAWTDVHCPAGQVIHVDRDGVLRTNA